MKKEKSCGAVVYKLENDQYKFLIIKQTKGHYSFPKGHVEDNETEIETAIREIKEETNIDVEIDSNFRVVHTYSPKPNVMKDVVYFIAKAINFDTHAQFEEVTEIMWLDYDQALQIISYDNSKELLKQSYEYLTKNKME